MMTRLLILWGWGIILRSVTRKEHIRGPSTMPMGALVHYTAEHEEIMMVIGFIDLSWFQRSRR